MNPPKGYYRELLPNSLRDIRIAFADVPMSGVSKVDNSQVLTVLDNSQDQHAKFYADGLRAGRLVTVVENNGGKVWKPGELFFGS